MPSPNVFLQSETIDRLKSHAEVLVDTYDSVIGRALDALENFENVVGNSDTSETDDYAGKTIRHYIGAEPPNLSYTSIHSVNLNGQKLSISECKWNIVLFETIRLAKACVAKDELRKLIIVNNVEGKKEDLGYKFDAELGISVQGQDANGAWKAIHHIIVSLKLSIDLIFAWQVHPKAANPGARGRFHMNKPN